MYCNKCGKELVGTHCQCENININDDYIQMNNNHISFEDDSLFKILDCFLGLSTPAIGIVLCLISAKEHPVVAKRIGIASAISIIGSVVIFVLLIGLVFMGFSMLLNLTN